MTRLQIADVLNKIILNNRFSIIERDDCHIKNESQINSMQDIFKLTKSSDFTYLYAVSELLSEDYENINKYLLNENGDSEFVENIRLPTRYDKLLVATAFEENLEFFSMAWNWVAIVTSELAEKKDYVLTPSADVFDNPAPDHNNEPMPTGTGGIVITLSPDLGPVSKHVNKEEKLATAATTDVSNLTYITVEPVGELQIHGAEGYDPFITAILFLKPESQNLIFEVKVSLEIDGNEHVFVIRKDSENAEYDVPASNPWFVDWSNGYKIKDFSWELL